MQAILYFHPVQLRRSKTDGASAWQCSGASSRHYRDSGVWQNEEREWYQVPDKSRLNPPLIKGHFVDELPSTAVALHKTPSSPGGLSLQAEPQSYELAQTFPPNVRRFVSPPSCHLVQELLNRHSYLHFGLKKVRIRRECQYQAAQQAAGGLDAPDWVAAARYLSEFQY